MKLVTISNSSTSCPATFGVYDITNTLFTAKWDGQGSGPSDGGRATHGVDGVHSPTSATPSFSLRTYVWWD